MLVFDRPSIFPSYPGISTLQSTIQPPPYPLIMHNSLVAGRKTRGYTRYSPAFISFTVLPDRPLQSTLEPRSRSSRYRPPQREDPRCLLRRRVPPLTRSSLEVPRQEASPFDLVVFVLAFLRQPCFLVSVLRYVCFR